MKKASTTLLILASLLLAGQAAARPQQGEPQTKARLRENINTLILVRLTQALDLTEDQTARLFPKLTRIDKEKAELQRRLGAEVRDLRAAVQDPATKEADLLSAVARIRGIRSDIRGLEERFDAVLDENLTPVQKAKYVVFAVDFYRGLGETINRAREMRGKIQRKP